jgi:diguanylate cyclase (GGDEF)-like protein
MDWTRAEFRSFIQSMQNTFKGRNAFLLLQTGNMGILPETWKEELSEIFKGQLYRKTLGNDVFMPYYPFLDLIRESKVLDNLKDGQYIRQRDLFQRYLSDEELTWGEELLKEELGYEKDQVLDAIWDAIDQVPNPHDRRRVILLEQAHHLPFSTIELLLEQERKTTLGNWLVILTFRPDFRENDDELWSDFLFSAEKKGELFNLKNEFNLPRTPKFTLGETEQVLDAAEYAYYLLAIEDAKILIQHLQKEMSLGNRRLEPAQQHRLWRLLGLIYYLKGEYDLSMSSYHQLLTLAQKYTHSDWQAEAFWRIGNVYYEKQQMDHAEKLALQGIKLSKEIGDLRNDFQSLVLYFRVQDRLRFQSVPEFEAFYLDIISKAEELEYWNTYAYLATNPFGLYSQYTPQMKANHEKGMQISEKIQNRYRMAVAYQTLGLVFSIKAEYHKVIDCYQKSLDIKKKLNDKLGLAQINNGLGYYHYMLGNHDKAQEYYMNAIVLLKEGKDFHEVAMTLFNLGANALLGQQPLLALDYLGRCRSLLRTLGMRNMSYHSEFGLTALTGLSHALLGNWSWAWKSFLTIRSQGLEPFAEKNEEFFWYHCFISVLDREGGHTEEVMENLQKAEFYLNRTNDNIQYMSPFFTWFKSTLQVDVVEKRNALEEAKLEARKKDNKFYMAFLEPGGAFPILTQEQFDLEWIQSAAKLQKHLGNLHQKVEEINFLNTFQATINQEIPRKSLIHKTVDAIYANFPFTFVAFHGMEGLKIGGEYYSRGRKPARLGDLKELLLTLATYPEKIAYNRNPIVDLEKDSDPLLSLFLGDKVNHSGHLLCIPEDNNYMGRLDSIQILDIMAGQLSLALDRRKQADLIIRQNEELKRKNLLLEKTSTTDHLTNLGNRSALFKALNLEMSRLKRHRPPQRAPLSLMFLDLDNFKKINDVFGHNVGDMVLSLTSELLSKTLRDTDLLFRYGGDEFVVLLPETSIQGGEEVGRRVIEIMEKQHSFLPEIKSTFGKTEHLTEDQELSCSIGLAQLGTGEAAMNDPEILLDQADQALYVAKRQGKGRLVVFTSELPIL